MSPVEIAATVFTVAYVVLAAKGNIWCWPAGMIGSALILVCDIPAKYYQDAVLQAFYVLAGIYGWVMWTRKNAQSGEALKIESRTFRQIFPLLFAGLILFPAQGYLFNKFGNSYSYIDAFTTVFSFIATYFTAKKVLESWLMWVIIDFIFIIQYALKEMYFISVLNLFLTVMAVYGYYEWRKQITINYVA
jgi:nicotinamide mononucleotide transporter